jgi:glutamate formiminotransferase
MPWPPSVTATVRAPGRLDAGASARGAWGGSVRLLGSVGGLVVLVAGLARFLQSPLELGLRLAHRTGQLGQLGPTEEDEDDEQDYEKFRCSKVHGRHCTFRRFANRIGGWPLLESVVNISEGSRPHVVTAIASSAVGSLLDVHSDVHHNRSVLTLVGEEAPRAVARAAVAALDLRRHQGVHPRFGVVDVVPFVPLAGSTLVDAVAARDRFLDWMASDLGVPGFAYGPERTLPVVRRLAFGGLPPDRGPSRPHPTAGATAVGARPVLVAWNVWLADPDLARAQRIAREIRGPRLRALGLPVGRRVQVSMNLVEPDELGPADAWDLVAERGAIAGAELVGLVPRSVLDRTDPTRWAELDLAEGKTIESRLARLS